MAAGGLARKLTTLDAVSIGLGSMIGAGVFAAFAPAARSAGSWLLAGLALAAVVAFCNATSSAQLAAQYPTSGGTYVYGREQLGGWWGFLAGWGFVVGKTASCAAMAMTFAAYAVPPSWQRPVAIAAVLVLAAVNYHGVTRTARLTQVIVAFVLVVLAIALVACLAASPVTVAEQNAATPGAYGVLQSAGLLFFAFAGYARVATMGEEVIDPKRSIPRAIVGAFAVVVVLYVVVAFGLLRTLGPVDLAASHAPVADAVARSGWGEWVAVVVRVGASAAALGALLSLIAGVGRTSLAMARERDLPRWLSAVHPRYAVPHHAEIALAVVVSVLLLFVDLRGAIGFSSFGVLVYYLIANLSAWRQRGADRRYPRLLQVIGATGCVVLVATVPWRSVVAGVTVYLLGIGYRVAVRRLSKRADRNRVVDRTAPHGDGSSRAH